MVFAFIRKFLTDFFSTLLCFTIILLEVAIWYRPWSEMAPARPFERNREDFEMVAEFMADYDLSPYWTDEELQRSGCDMDEFNNCKLESIWSPRPSKPMVQPDDAVREAAQRLFKRAKLERVIKTGRHPETVIFMLTLRHRVQAKDGSGWYKERGLAYSAQAGVPPSFAGLELGVGVLEPIDEHWYCWYADTPD